jgi:lysozyme
VKTSPAGISFIQRNEGLVLREYNDNGHLAIGYGHDLKVGENFPNGITPQEAALLLVGDLTEIEPIVTQLAPQANQNQFDALVDFTYNLGGIALKTMLSHGWEQVPVQIPRWDNVAGVPNKGLAARRAQEVALFTS